MYLPIHFGMEIGKILTDLLHLARARSQELGDTQIKRINQLRARLCKDVVDLACVIMAQTLCHAGARLLEAWVCRGMKGTIVKVDEEVVDLGA